jgi:hypothetical protein
MRTGTIAIVVITCLAVMNEVGYAQKKWDGGASTSSWNDAANWAPDGVPTSSDSVILDNTNVSGNYTVILGGSTKRGCKSLQILGDDSDNPVELTLGGSTDSLLTVDGVLWIQSGGVFRDTGSAGVVVGGDLLVEGGVFRAATDGSPTYAISGSLNISDGTFEGTTGTGSPTFNIAGSFSVGAFATYSGTTGSGKPTFNMSGVGESISFDGTISNATHDMNIDGSIFLFSFDVPVDAPGTLTVNGELDFSGKAVTGTGNFTLACGGTLKIDSDDGITSSGAAGNVQVSGTRTYCSSAEYHYTGSSLQNTGNGLPASVGTLRIFNSSGVNLGVSTTVTLSLSLELGTLTLGSNNLTIGGGATISSASSASHVVTNGTGALRRIAGLSTPVDFPVGNSYNPLTIVNPGAADTFSVRVKSSFDNAPPDPTKVVNKQWTITKAGAADAGVTLRLFWNAADQAAGFDRTGSVVIGRYTGSQWVETAATVDTPSPGLYRAVAGGFTSFSNFAVGNGGALPVQVASFTASVVRDKDVEVTWRTVSETNNYGFEIERKRIQNSEVRGRDVGNQSPSSSGQWKKVGFVEGHGTTLTPQDYSYVDRSVPFGRYAYRIKQIDLDGKSETFTEKEVLVGVYPDKLILAQNYPNPFNPSTVIEFVVPQAGLATLKVYNVLGQEVAILFEEDAEAGTIYTARFDATNLASGLYFYRLRGAGIVETKRMLLIK